MYSRSRFNEFDLVESINNHRISQLNKNLLTFMQTLFGVVDRDEIAYARVLEGKGKPDIVVKYKDKEKYVSIKSGSAKVFHNCQLTTFIDFLKSQNISEKSLETIQLFHYADGTTNGTGARRMGTEELFESLGDRIKEMNQELNADREFIKKFAEYVMFQGYNPNIKGADAVYLGDYDSGMCTLKEQFIKYFERDKFSWQEYPHIGPFLFRPHARYTNSEIKRQDRHDIVDVYWPHFDTSIRFIARNYPSFNVHLKNGNYC